MYVCIEATHTHTHPNTPNCYLNSQGITNTEGTLNH